MSEADQRAAPPWAGPAAERLWRDVREMARLRRRLAELELRQDLAAAKRLAMAGGLGLAVAASAAPLAAAALAWRLDGAGGLSAAAWTGLFAAGAAVVGPGMFWLAWRRFRRGLSALRETRAELREDLAWLRGRLS